MPPAPYPTTLGGQRAWVHDEGQRSGHFHTFDALDLGSGPRKVHVFLPRGSGAGGARYPVVYMNDGDTAFWPGEVGKTWDVAGRLDPFHTDRRVPEVIVVAVHPRERNHEYTHAAFAPGRPCCGAAAYAGELADRLKPFIDAHYPTRPEREATAIFGASHGGLAAFLIATLRPDAFGLAACHSPSFWVGLDPVHGGAYPGGPLETSALIDLARPTLTDPARRPRLWIDWGLVREGGHHNAGIEAAAALRGREMADLLASRFDYGPMLAWAEDPLGEHDEISWGRRFPAALTFLFGDSTRPVEPPTMAEAS